MPNTIIERLRDGRLVRVMSFGGLSSAKYVELAGMAGNLHGIWIDQEHSAVPQRELERMLMACRAVGLDAFARVAPTDYTAVMRPMEAGCSGVMIAQIRTMDQVRCAVAWAKYPPQGVRGMYGLTYEADYAGKDMAAHVERANRQRWLAVQIETAEAVEIVDEIAAVDGVDMLFVGPADLSVALGVPGEFLHAKCVDALTRVAAAVKNAGKYWGALCPHIDHARKCRELGCQLYSLTSDVGCVRAGLQAMEIDFVELMED